MTGLINYDTGSPNPDDPPSFDVFSMASNASVLNQIWGIDHKPFNTNFSGTHTQTAFADKISPPALLNSGLTPSVAFPAAGTADPTSAQYFFKNQQAIAPLSCIRCFASFLTLAAAGTNQVTPITSYNLINTMVNPTGITQTSKSYTITLLDNVIFQNSFVIIPFIWSTTQTISFTFTNPTLVITTSGNVPNVRIDFVMIQI